MKKITIIIIIFCFIIATLLSSCFRKTDVDKSNDGQSATPLVEVDPSAYGPLVGFDNMDNALPTAEQTGEIGVRKRQVALFYFLCHESDRGPYKFSDVLSQNPDPLKPPNQKPWIGTVSYYWGEPLFGYYKTDDTWVMRKHVELLTYANIDFLIFDTTNLKAYIPQALKLMEILDEYQNEGWKTPKVVFYTNTDSDKRMMHIYEGIYALNKFSNTWYMVDGKPLIIGVEKNSSSEINSFFTMRSSQWPSVPDVANGFPWIDFKEKPSIYPDKNGANKVVSVSVAQNSASTFKFGDSIFYGETGNRGRSYHNGNANITEDSYIYGYNFQQQWDNAISSDADIAMILSWNEWTAGAWNESAKSPNKPIAIFDCITPEYSRDIEPMRGGYSDNYYMQMVANIRRFKGTEKTIVQSTQKTININSSFEQWLEILVNYKDFSNGALKRDQVGIGRKKLVNNTARNGFVSSKVTQDKDNMYFYVQTQEPISPFDNSEGCWMRLYLNINSSKENSWNRYNYIVNYLDKSLNKTSVAKYINGQFEKVGEADYSIQGNQMMILVPKVMLDISGNIVEFEFKWADSREEFESIVDFYDKGDAMPYGRFNYLYKAK